MDMEKPAFGGILDLKSQILSVEASKLFDRTDLLPFPDLSREDTPSGRFYLVEGDRLPSATTILSHTERSDWLQEWIARVGQERADSISKYGADRGTYVHGMIHRYLNNELINKMHTPPDYFWAFKRLKGLVDRIDKILLMERPVYSQQYRFAGTVDCCAEFDGSLSVIDFKTYSRPKTRDQLEAAFIQTCLYAIAIEEEAKVLLKINLDINSLVVIFSAESTCSGVEVAKKEDFKEKALARIARFHAGL